MRIRYQQIHVSFQLASLAAWFAVTGLIHCEATAQTTVKGRVARDSSNTRVAPQESPPQQTPTKTVDTRSGTLAGEEGDFLLTPSESIAAWKHRKNRVRQIMQVALGLWPGSYPNASERDYS